MVQLIDRIKYVMKSLTQEAKKEAKQPVKLVVKQPKKPDDSTQQLPKEPPDEPTPKEALTPKSKENVEKEAPESTPKPFKEGLHGKIKEKLGSGVLQEAETSRLEAYADSFRDLMQRAKDADDEESQAAIQMAITSANEEQSRREQINKATPREEWDDKTEAAFTRLKDQMDASGDIQTMKWAVSDINDGGTASVDLDDVSELTIEDIKLLEGAGIIESTDGDSMDVGHAFMEQVGAEKETTSIGGVRYNYELPEEVEVPEESPAEEPPAEEVEVPEKPPAELKPKQPEEKDEH